MPLATRLRVTSSFLAVPLTYHRGFITIPAGATIETSDDLVRPGLVEVSFDGKNLLAFTRDIRERTEPVPRKVAEAITTT
jgi:hypothetical protein